jgi:hypothetical protein
VIEISDFGKTIRTYKVLDDGNLTIKDDEVLWAEDGTKVDRSNRRALMKRELEKRHD